MAPVQNQATYRQRLRDAAAAKGVPQAKFTPQTDMTVVIAASPQVPQTAEPVPAPAKRSAEFAPVVGEAVPVGEPAVPAEIIIESAAAWIVKNKPAEATPEVLREYAYSVVDSLLQMEVAAYDASLVALQTEDPTLYAIVVDELQNLSAAAGTAVDSQPVSDTLAADTGVVGE